MHPFKLNAEFNHGLAKRGNHREKEKKENWCRRKEWDKLMSNTCKTLHSIAIMASYCKYALAQKKDEHDRGTNARP